MLKPRTHLLLWHPSHAAVVRLSICELSLCLRRTLRLSGALTRTIVHIADFTVAPVQRVGPAIIPKVRLCLLATRGTLRRALLFALHLRGRRGRALLPRQRLTLLLRLLVVRARGLLHDMRALGSRGFPYPLVLRRHPQKKPVETFSFVYFL